MTTVIRWNARRIQCVVGALVLAVAGSLVQLTGWAPSAHASTTYTFSNPSLLLQSWSAPSDGEISVTVRGGAGSGLAAVTSGNASSGGGTGTSITVRRSVLATNGFTIRIYPGGSNGGNCGSGTAGPSAAIYVNNTGAVVAGGGGGGGCNGASGLSSITPGDGGNAGVPSGQGTFAGTDGSDADNGDPSHVVTGGGGGGTASGGSAGSGLNYSTLATCCSGQSGSSFSTYPMAVGGDGGGGTGVGGGGGGGRYSGGGGGGTGANAGAGGGGGSSYVGPDWTFVSATPTSSTGGEIVIVFTPANDADLSDLQISQGSLSPTFAAATTGYTATVASSVTAMTVTPTASASGAGITVNGTPVTNGSPSGAISLTPGSNTITVIVTALDGTTTKSYTVTVTRATSSDADLANLEVDSGSLSPTFSAAVTAYTVDVPTTASSITVTPTVSDVGATVTVDGVGVTSGNASAPISLAQGSTIISVVVTATDSSTLTYTITVVLSGGNAASQVPPSWYQAYQRPTQDSVCLDGWNPSWAQWPNAFTGGWTCERTIYWSLVFSTWQEVSGFRSGRL